MKCKRLSLPVFHVETTQSDVGACAAVQPFLSDGWRAMNESMKRRAMGNTISTVPITKPLKQLLFSSFRLKNTNFNSLSFSGCLEHLSFFSTSSPHVLFSFCFYFHPDSFVSFHCTIRFTSSRICCVFSRQTNRQTRTFNGTHKNRRCRSKPF